MFRILVVDDDKNTRFLFKTILEKANYTVFSVTPFLFMKTTAFARNRHAPF